MGKIEFCFPEKSISSLFYWDGGRDINVHIGIGGHFSLLKMGDWKVGHKKVHCKRWTYLMRIGRLDKQRRLWRIISQAYRVTTELRLWRTGTHLKFNDYSPVPIFITAWVN